MRKIMTSILLMGLASILYTAQNADEIIVLKVKCRDGTLKRGESNLLILEIDIKAPYHIISDTPVFDYVVPTSLSFDERGGLKYSGPLFPEPKIKIFTFSETSLSIFEKTIQIQLDLTVSSSYRADNVNVSGVLNYQACDDVSCLAPSYLTFSRMFPVVGKKTAVSEFPEEQKIGSKEPSSKMKVGRSKEGQFEKLASERNLLLTFFLIFIGGLALNLTPCVYPIIPITISYFGGQAQGRKGRILTHTVLYILGIAVTYSTLGVIAAFTGNIFGSAMQNPLVLIGIVIVLITLAMSMFNLYEFRLPSFITRLAGETKKGYIGSLFIGLTVGFVAAPCIGPFVLGLLTYVGERGDVFHGFIMLFILALGMGLPFLFLALVSGSINKLPKSGAWMVWIRTMFGFILLAIAVYFLSPLFSDPLIYNLALALFLFAGGIYLAWIEPTKFEGKVFFMIRNFVGIIFFAVALIFAANGIKSYVDLNMESSLINTGNLTLSNRINWAVFSEEWLQTASAESKPVFIDFFSDWCIPCHEMDRSTFIDSRIVERSKNFIMLKMDLTRAGDPFAKKIEKKYLVKGAPTYVFLKPDGTEIQDLRIVGYIKADRLLTKMDSAVELCRRN